MSPQNLVKGAARAFLPQVIENTAKINFKKCPNHPLRNAILNIWSKEKSNTTRGRAEKRAFRVFGSRVEIFRVRARDILMGLLPSVRAAIISWRVHRGYEESKGRGDTKS